MPSLVCSVSVRRSLATRVLKYSLSSLSLSSTGLSSTSGSTSTRSTDSWRVVTCSFRAFTSERMAEIASVSAGVSCSDVLSSSRSPPCLCGGKLSQLSWGNKTLLYLVCQLRWPEIWFLCVNYLNFPDIFSVDLF